MPYPGRADNTPQRDDEFLQQAVRPGAREQGAPDAAAEEAIGTVVGERSDDMRGGVRGQAARGPDHAQVGAGLRQQAAAVRDTGGEQPDTGLQREAVGMEARIE